MSELTVREPKAGNATQKALQVLRFQIISGALMPGEQIRQQEMAEQLGVSRVPLREALGILADFGLLEHRPNSGFFVVKRARNEVQQIVRMLCLLENELMDSLTTMPSETLEALAKLHKEMAAAVADEDCTPFLLKNRQFHFHIFDRSPHKIIFGEVQRLWLLADPFIALKLSTIDERQRAVREHGELLAALKKGDMEDAGKIMNGHRGTLP
ncbi:GntR family transcriptional regulator [Trinickia terrae]|uniref:GntR family transcriptional regulator n=1 Tax=Trinickia terrae TaxID=2571161 RepID=A0A4U1I9A7_9BURK|nr:GntR family transcriptional regulator [Trinickia terrae]TKC90052.1 GntR family transcriptional regulator [Trinickia terrae]